MKRLFSCFIWLLILNISVSIPEGWLSAEPCTDDRGTAQVSDDPASGDIIPDGVDEPLETADTAVQSCKSGSMQMVATVHSVMNPGPNLAFEGSFNTGVIHAFANPECYAHFYVANNGTSEASGYNMGLYLSIDQIFSTSDICIDLEPGPTLGPGGSQYVNLYRFGLNTYRGYYYIGVVLDLGNSIAEDNENDNIKFSLSSYQFLPDLFVSDVTLISRDGSRLSFKITIINIGCSATDGSKIKSRFYLSSDKTITAADYEIHDWNLTKVMNSGQSETSYDLTTTVGGIPAGDYYLGVIMDAEEAVPETNENNNTAHCNVVIGIVPEDNPQTEPFVLDVPVAKIPPVIDGIMDPIWYSVCFVPMEKFNTAEASAPDSWLDAFGSFKLMFDQENFYAFVRVNDDVINTSFPDYSWANDSFELLFDGDNSKNGPAAGNDENDVLFQYVYGETAEHYGNAPHSICSFTRTETGYDLEIEIPAGDIPFDLKSGHLFGFEMHMNDNDTGFRDHIVRWWNEDNATWHDPSLMGTARTTSYIAADPMYILQAPAAPVIDGSADEEAWENIPWFSDNTFVMLTGEWLLSPPFDIGTAEGWNDCRFNWKLMWQGGMLYFFARVFDDVIDTSEGNFWMNDGIELHIDGANNKSLTLDGNDSLYAYVFSILHTSRSDFETTSSGWTVEAGIDLGSDQGITPEIGCLMGLDVQFNDNDGGGRDLWSRWWGNDDRSRTDPSLRGTVRFAGRSIDIPDDVASGGNNRVGDFCLYPNRPNPFNPFTEIRYTIRKSCPVNLTVHDLLGREVAVLAHGPQAPGEYSVRWNGKDFPSGIYICHLRAGSFRETKKLVLQK